MVLIQWWESMVPNYLEAKNKGLQLHGLFLKTPEFFSLMKLQVHWMQNLKEWFKKLLTGLCLRFLFLALTISISISCLASSCGACEQVFICGKYVLEYPFGRKNSSCGDPALQLDCDDGQKMPLLNISGYPYYILPPAEQSAWPEYHLQWERDNKMTLVDGNLIGDKCYPSSSNHATQFWSSHEFHIVDGYENIILWGDCVDEKNEEILLNAPKLKCNNSWYYSRSTDSRLTPFCKLLVQVPVRNSDISALLLNRSEILREGFQIRWSVTVRCKDCESSGGLCGYNSWGEFHCNCSTGTVHPDKCPAVDRPPLELPNIAKSGIKPKTKISIIGVGIGAVVLLVIGVPNIRI